MRDVSRLCYTHARFASRLRSRRLLGVYSAGDARATAITDNTSRPHHRKKKKKKRRGAHRRQQARSRVDPEPVGQRVRVEVVPRVLVVRVRPCRPLRARRPRHARARAACAGGDGGGRAGDGGVGVHAAAEAAVLLEERHQRDVARDMALVSQEGQRSNTVGGGSEKRRDASRFPRTRIYVLGFIAVLQLKIRGCACREG